MCMLVCPLEKKVLFLFSWIMPIGGEMTFSNFFVVLDIFLIECQRGGEIGEIQCACVLLEVV